MAGLRQATQISFVRKGILKHVSPSNLWTESFKIIICQEATICTEWHHPSLLYNARVMAINNGPYSGLMVAQRGYSTWMLIATPLGVNSTRASFNRIITNFNWQLSSIMIRSVWPAHWLVYWYSNKREPEIKLNRSTDFHNISLLGWITFIHSSLCHYNSSTELGCEYSLCLVKPNNNNWPAVTC